MLEYLRDQAKLLTLQQNYDDIVSKHSSDIGHTHLEEMTIDTYPNLPPVMNKPDLLPHNYDKFAKEEIDILLEVGLIERSLSPYAASIIVVPRKGKPGAPLAETKQTSNQLL